MRPSDARRQISTLKKEFTNIDFSLCTDNEDILWTCDRETEKHIRTRIYNFFKWVMSRPEDNIAILTHNGFISRLFEEVGLGKKEVQNCEIISTRVKNKKIDLLKI